MSLQPHQQRVVDEKIELDTKILRLEAFSMTTTCGNLPEAERERLVRQRCLMQAYSEVLGERIDAFANGGTS